VLNVLLFNPRAAKYKPRIPNSILQVAASIEGQHNYMIVDGNLEEDPETIILNYFSKETIQVFACTVMPGPQLKQAIPLSKKLKQLYPQLKIVWGGYFPSNQPGSVLHSGYVDYIINGPGDKAFPNLLAALEQNASVSNINNKGTHF
jgi:anaerobic magnesium-protoporphyrin IX monomethyl ester cyclase